VRSTMRTFLVLSSVIGLLGAKGIIYQLPNTEASLGGIHFPWISESAELPLDQHDSSAEPPLDQNAASERILVVDGHALETSMEPRRESGQAPEPQAVSHPNARPNPADPENVYAAAGPPQLVNSGAPETKIDNSWYTMPSKAKEWYEGNCMPMVSKQPKTKKRDSKWYRGNVAVNSSGAWGFSSCWAVYHLDVSLAKAYSKLFVGSRVVELGAGCGCYTSFLLSQEGLHSISAFDGVSNIEHLTRGLVQNLDLSTPGGQQIPTHDWTLCTEVGEHVPAKFEDEVLTNIAANAQRGIVLSWAIPGQHGHSHVNTRSNEYIIKKMLARSFVYDANTTQLLRTAATTGYFKKSLMVFLRSPTPAAQ